jgi:CHAT domain-containing protein
MRRELSARYPKYGQLLAIALVKADVGRRSLAPDAVFVSWLFARDRLYAYAMARDQPLAVVDLGSAADLPAAIDAYRQVIGTPKPLPLWRAREGAYVHGIARPDPQATRASAGELARHLSDRLLAPLYSHLGAKRQWILSPDEALAALPFEALPWQGSPVVSRHTVRYVQSLSVHALVEERHRALEQRRNRAPLLAMGAARYAGGDAMPAGTARKAGWADLPASEREVDGVAALFAQTVVRKRAAASEAELMRLDRSGELAGFRRILFSTHAYLSPGDPRLSALVLDQVDRATGTDGYVTVAELPGYTLASDLVVLSACETGLGRIVRGEGIMGLPYALYLAGNADAIVSLWPVLDGSTAEFMRRLFAHLRQGASHADALAAVKRESLRDPARRDPLTWAAFVLYGTR